MFLGVQIFKVLRAVSRISTKGVVREVCKHKTKQFVIFARNPHEIENEIFSANKGCSNNPNEPPLDLPGHISDSFQSKT